MTKNIIIYFIFIFQTKTKNIIYKWLSVKILKLLCFVVVLELYKIEFSSSIEKSIYNECIKGSTLSNRKSKLWDSHNFDKYICSYIKRTLFKKAIKFK